MRPNTLVVTVLCVALSSVAAFAQNGLSGDVSPNLATPGATITLTVTEAHGQGVTLPSSCLFTSISAGEPGGPAVQNYFCLAVLTPIGPCQTYAQTWDQKDFNGQQVPDGDYFFNVSYFDAAFSGPFLQSFVVTISSGGNRPVLSTSGPATLGALVNLSLNAPADPNGIYICVASLTTNFGIPLPVGHVATDVDALLTESFPNPNPSLFAGFQGFLDGTGSTSSIFLLVPNDPQLSCYGFTVQAVALSPTFFGHSVRISNPLTFTIP